MRLCRNEHVSLLSSKLPVRHAALQEFDGDNESNGFNKNMKGHEHICIMNHYSHHCEML
jgi:hypothetical protein